MCNHNDEHSITAILCWTAHCQCNIHISAYWPNAELMLARRLRRRPNINTALGQRIVFVGHRQVWYKNSVSCDSVSAALYITVILVWVSEPEYNNNGDVVMATEVTSVPDGCDSDHPPPPSNAGFMLTPAQHKNSIVCWGGNTLAFYYTRVYVCLIISYHRKWKGVSTILKNRLTPFQFHGDAFL